MSQHDIQYSRINLKITYLVIFSPLYLDMETQLSTADWVMLCVYFAAMAGMTFLAYKKQKGLVEYFFRFVIDFIYSEPVKRATKLRQLLSWRPRDELGGGGVIPFCVEYRLRGELTKPIKLETAMNKFPFSYHFCST